jgi:uncharacterized surface protein with fasciclin (FAS1) repeats
MHTFTKPPVFAAMAAAMLTLSACADEAEDGQAGQAAEAEPSGETLAEAVSDAEGLTTVAEALRDVGLTQVFDGAGSYTILAPNDDAFAALGETREALTEPDQRAAIAAVLRDHIVPGYLTPADIEAAIDAQGGAVQAESMGEQTLRFTRDGEGIRVTSEDGSTAMIAGEALRARNGVAIPVDGVLKNLSPPA